MKRVLVIGSGGAGKSTFARRLGARLGLPVVHLDRVFWHAGWVPTPKDEWRRKVVGLCAGEAWVIDGNFSGTFELRLAACDTVIFLDLPRALCMWRVVKRAYIYRKTGRPDMAEGCRERLNFEFLSWVWNYGKRSRPKLLSRIEGHGRDKQVITLSSSADVEKFLAEVG